MSFSRGLQNLVQRFPARSVRRGIPLETSKINLLLMNLNKRFLCLINNRSH